MAFKFKFASLLQYRKDTENIARKNYAESIFQLMKEEKILKEMQLEIMKGFESLERHLKKARTTVFAISTAQDFIYFMKVKIVKQQEILSKLWKIAEGKKQLLIKSVQDKKVLVKLEEKQKQVYLKKERRKIAQLGDLIAQNKKISWMETNDEKNA